MKMPTVETADVIGINLGYLKIMVGIKSRRSSLLEDVEYSH
jgi:hypothetical protein